MKTALKLTEAERAYWPIITRARTVAWNEADTIRAALLARDLATMEELSILNVDAAVMGKLAQRINEGARLLKLSPDLPGDTRQHKIARIVFEELDG